MWPFRTKRGDKRPVVVTADHGSVTITIRKDWLINRSATDTAAAGILRLAVGTESPKKRDATGCVEPMLNEIEVAALLSSNPVV